MKHLREQLQALQTEEVVNKLIDKSIEDKIKTGTYSPKEEWSPGSEEIIRSFSRCAIDHQFEQSLTLLKTIEKFELNGEIAQ